MNSPSVFVKEQVIKNADGQTQNDERFSSDPLYIANDFGRRFSSSPPTSGNIDVGQSRSFTKPEPVGKLINHH